MNMPRWRFQLRGCSQAMIHVKVTNVTPETMHASPGTTHLDKQPRFNTAVSEYRQCTRAQALVERTRAQPQYPAYDALEASY